MIVTARIHTINFLRNTMKQYLIAIIIAGFFFPAMAEKAEKIEVIKVTGQTAPHETNTVDIGLIDNLNPNHLSELINTVVGVESIGTHSLVTRVNFRGLEDRDLAILKEGVRQANPLWTHIGNMFINPNIINNLQVNIGKNTVTTHGLGGSMNIETLSADDLLLPSKNSALRLEATHNTNASSEATWRLAQRFSETTSFLYSGAFQDNQNIELSTGDEKFGTAGSRVNHFGKLTIDTRVIGQLEFIAESFDIDGDFLYFPDLNPKLSLQLTNGELIPTDLDYRFYAVKSESSPFSLGKLTVVVAKQNSQMIRDESALSGVFGRGDVLEGGINVDSTSAFWTHVGDTTNLQFGAEWYDYETSFSQNRLMNQPASSQDRTDKSFFAQMDWFVTSDIKVIGGLRWEEVLEQSAQYQRRFDDITNSLAIHWTPTEQWLLSAQYTSLFKAPELNRPFSGSGFNKIDNPELTPESGSNVELTAQYQSVISGIPISLSWTRFDTTINNAIIETSVPLNENLVIQDVNVGQLVIRGHEIEIVAGGNNFNGSLGFSQANYDSSQLDFEPFVLTRADAVYAWRETGDKLRARLFYNPIAMEALSFTLQSEFAFKKTTFNDEVKESYNTHNVYMNYELTSNFTFSVAITNLTNEVYVPHTARTGIIENPIFGLVEFNDFAVGRNFRINVSYDL